jgi:hypothetical protein
MGYSAEEEYNTRVGRQFVDPKASLKKALDFMNFMTDEDAFLIN